MAQRLIDLDEAIKEIKSDLESLYWNSEKERYERGVDFALDRLEDMETVDPVKKGKWEIKLDDFDCEYMKCSCCGVEFYNGDNDTVDTLHNFCPNCGAQMNKE